MLNKGSSKFTSDDLTMIKINTPTKFVADHSSVNQNPQIVNKWLYMKCLE